MQGIYKIVNNELTGDIIPAGRNLRSLCERRGLSNGAMCSVKNGKWKHYKGWVLVV